MFIGDVAKATGVTVKALRFYEAQQLLGAVPRRGRYRTYDDSHLERIALIRHSKGLGLTLAEIHRVVAARGAAEASAIALTIVEAKMEACRQHMQQARRNLRSLGDARQRILRCIAS